MSVAGAALAVSALALAQQPAAAQPKGGPAPRLILALSVDQMRHDYLVRFAPLFQGGFKLLLDRGAVFENALYRHANCETGPGHSVLLSGRNARHSGIISNAWYDEVLGRVVNVVDDDAIVPVGGQGRGASPARFIGFTLGDLIKKRTKASRVVGVALKDRAAILMAGPRADAAYWYELEGGRFITSSYYMKTAPAWLDALNARHVPDSYAGKSWTKLLADESVYEKYAGMDDVPTELDGKDTVFPHRIQGAPPSTKFYDAFRRTPFADQLTLDVALEAMKAHDLGSDDATDVLAIGFSATDVIGHGYGPDSHEILDQMLRLDLTLKRLFDAVDARVGLDKTLVFLSADHAVMPLVERLQAEGKDAHRAFPDTFLDPVKKRLAERFPGKSGLIAAYVAPEFYLDLAAVRRQGLTRAAVETAVAEGLMSTGLVARVYTAKDFVGEPPVDDPYFEPVARSYFEPRSPHVIPRLKEYVYFSTWAGGTGHGTAYEYDRHVPLVFMGAAIKPGRYATPCGPEDIAPTLGTLLGLDYPLQDAGRRLTEMLRLLE